MDYVASFMRIGISILHAARPHSVPAPYHIQTGSIPGTLSERSPDETEWTEDRPSAAQSPTTQ